MQVSDLIAAIAGTSVTQGFDALFAVDLADINALLFQAYADGGPLGPVQTIRHTLEVPGEPAVEIDLAVGPPLLTFTEDPQPGALLSMWVTTGTVTIADAGGTTTLSLAPHSVQITGIVPVTQLAGQVRNSYDVVLDLAAGAFSVLHSGMDTMNAGQAGQAIAGYFASTSTRYGIGTVVYSKLTDYACLEPTSFAVSVQSDPSGSQCLLIFITSDGPPGTVDQVSLPGGALPVPDGYTTALYLSSRALFGGVLAPQLSAAMYAAGYTGTVTTTAVQGTRDGALAYSLTAAPAGGISVPGIGRHPGPSALAWTTSGMWVPASELTVSNVAGAIGGTWAADWPQAVSYQTEPGGPLTPDLADFTMSFPASVRLAITDGAEGQEVALSLTPGALTLGVSPAAQSAGPDAIRAIFSGSNLTAIGDQLAASLGQTLGRMFGFDFSPISVFALENLLAAGQAQMLLQSVYVPGDLLVVGAVTGRIAVRPVQAWLLPGQQLPLSVPGLAPGQSVTWACDPFVDSIDRASGIFTAPAVTENTLVLVTATADGSSGVAAVVVSPPLVVNPASVTMPAGESDQPVQFIATQLGLPAPSVTWAISPQVGQISADGTYYQPESPGPQTITVTAQSADDGTVSATATIQLQPASRPESS